MEWQTSAKVLKDVDTLLDPKKSKNTAVFEKDYYEMTWELSVAEDGSYWLNA